MCSDNFGKLQGIPHNGEVYIFNGIADKIITYISADYI